MFIDILLWYEIAMTLIFFLHMWRLFYIPKDVWSYSCTSTGTSKFLPFPSTSDHSDNW